MDKKENKADLLLHPIRMRIIMALAGRRLTSQQIAEILTDVPPATLYRHIGKLYQNEFLHLVEQRPVRGTVEKVFALSEGSVTFNDDDLRTATHDDHLRFFLTFVAGLLDDFSRYLDSNEEINVRKDGVSYRKTPIYATDEEIYEFSRKMLELVMPMLHNEPLPGRRRRLLSTILMPAEDIPEIQE